MATTLKNADGTTGTVEYGYTDDEITVMCHVYVDKVNAIGADGVLCYFDKFGNPCGPGGPTRYEQRRYKRVEHGVYAEIAPHGH